MLTVLGSFGEASARKRKEPKRSKADAALAEKYNQDALEAYRGQDFVQAARLFERAYNADPSPLLLWNMARAYDSAGDRDAALRRYRMFTDHPEAPTARVETAHTRIQVLEALQLAEEAQRAPPVKPKRPKPPVVGEPKVGKGRPATILDRRDPPPNPSRTTAYVLMGTAAATAAGAITLFVMARSEAASLDDDLVAGAAGVVPRGAVTQHDAQKRADRVETFETVSLVLAGATGLLVAVGTVLLATATDAPAEGTPSLRPAVGPNSAGVLVEGRF